MEKQVTKCEFENQFPMAKIFEVDSLCYIYDGKSGLLAEITADEIKQIYNYRFHSNTINLTGYLKGLFLDGVFLPGPLIQITPKQKELNEIISFHLEFLYQRMVSFIVAQKQITLSRWEI